MKKIPLSSGDFVLIDDQDFSLVSVFRWYPIKKTYTQYAVQYAMTTNTKVKCLMHRLILQAKKGELVDHINFNGLDNRRENIRIVNHSESLRHRRRYFGKGIRCISKSGKKLRVDFTLSHPKRKVYIGSFDTYELAKEAVLNFRAKELKAALDTPKE